MTQFVQKQQVLVDYSNRCAVALIYDEVLAVIPFVPSRDASGSQSSTGGEKKGSTSTMDSDSFRTSKKTMSPSYLVHLPELGITNIKDISFLHGYYEPTLMIIYEPTGTWAGRLAKTRNTVAVAIVELDITLRRKMLIWSMDKLPHDCYRICPLKYPGGAIIFSANALLFVDHSSKYRLTLNVYGDNAANDPDVVGKYVLEKSKVPISLDDAKYTFLSESVALLSLESGALYFLTVFSDGRSVTHIDLAPAGNSVVTTGLCTLTDRYFFVAARLANSLLLSYTPHIDQSVKKVKQEAIEGLDPRAKFGTFTDWCDPEDLDEQVVDLLSDVKATKLTEADEHAALHKAKKYDLATVDTIVSIAPAGDLIFQPKDNPDEPAPHPTTDPNYVPKDDPVRNLHRRTDPDGIFDMIASCGYERSGGIAVISKSLPHNVIDECVVSGVTGAWALYAIPDSVTNDSAAANPSNGSTMDEDLPARQRSAKRGSEIEVPTADADAAEPAQPEDKVFTGEGGEPAGDFGEDPQHKVILLTGSQQTTIFVETDAGLAPISGDNDFLNGEETLFAGNVGSGQRIVQIGFYEIVVLNASFKRVQHIPFEGTDADGNDLYAIWSSIFDPYVLVMTSDHQLVLYEANQESLELEKIPMPLFDAHNTSTSAKIVTLQLFMDTNNMIGFNSLNTEGKEALAATSLPTETTSTLRASQGVPSQSTTENTEDGIIFTEDDVSEMMDDATELELYSNAREFSTSKRGQKSQDAVKSHLLGRAIHTDYLDRPVFFTLAREDGQFEIWKLSPGEEVSTVVNLAFRSSNLHNGRQYMDHENDAKKQVSGSMDGEICIAPVGTQHSLPFLVVKLDDGRVYTYSCQYYKNALVSEKFLPIRFVRMPLNALCHNLQLKDHLIGPDGQPIVPPEIETELSVITAVRKSLTHPTLIPFFGLAQGARYSGIFVSGDTPLWLFCERDYLRPQRLSETTRKGPFAARVSAFASVNTPSCAYGFLVVQEGVMQLCSLDSDWDVEFSAGASLCARRVTLQETVHALSYDRENHFIIATTSTRKKEMLRYLRGAADDKKEADLAKKIAEGLAQPLVYDMSTLDPRLPPIWEDMYFVKLLDPQTWKVIAQYECAPEEVATAKCMNLFNYIPMPPIDPTPAAVLGTTYEAKQIVAPYKKVPVLVVGTSIVRGEDAACKGRIVIIDIVPEPNEVITDESSGTETSVRKARLEVRAERACLQPITALDSLDGHLLTAEGRSFYVYQLRVQGGLYRIGFLDAQLSTVSITVIQNYVLYGDMHHSIRLMRWLKAPHNWLQLVAKDPSPLETIGTGAIVEGDKVTWLATDERGNLYMHSFSPSAAAELVPSLEPVGDYHIGSKVRNMLRFRTGSLPSDKPGGIRNHGSVVSGLDGTVGFILPVDSRAFNILKKLEAHLVSALEHVAGLHPFAYRYPKPAHRMAHPHNRAVLDGDLLWRFMHLERTKQEELARAVQVHVEHIIDLFATFGLQGTFE